MCIALDPIEYFLIIGVYNIFFVRSGLFNGCRAFRRTKMFSIQDFGDLGFDPFETDIQIGRRFQKHSWSIVQKVFEVL